MAHNIGMNSGGWWGEVQRKRDRVRKRERQRQRETEIDLGHKSIG